MIELLLAYLLWEGGAGAEWWVAFAGLLAYKAYNFWMIQKAMAEVKAEIFKVKND